MHCSEGMEFGYDTVSLNVVSGEEGLRAQNADSLSIYLRAAVSSSNTELTYNILLSVPYNSL